MRNKFSRRGVLAGLLAGAASPALANAPLQSLRPVPRPGSVGIPEAAQIVAGAKLGGITAYAVARADGTVLEAHAARALLPPASVAKSVTALYAMDALGASYRFATVLMGTGPIEDGVLKGDLILKGTGDPIFDTDALGGLAGQLADAGVKNIEGGFFVDGRALPPLDQIDPAQLAQSGYNPSVSGINLNYNRVHFEWRRAEGSYDLTMDARARRYQPSVRSATMRMVSDAYPVFTHRKGDTREHWTVARPALGNGGARWLPVRMPERYAGDVFRTLAGSMGVKVPVAELEVAPLRGAVLASHISPSLRGLCGGMLRYSTNLTAEVLGLRATQAQGVEPDSLVASAAEMNAWARDAHGVEMALVDHSGLGDASRVSCDGLVRMMTRAEGLEPMLKTIAVKDAQGAVRENAPYNIRAKTGTLNFVSSLAGYVTPQGGERLSFAIISADLARRAAIPENDRERPAGSKTYARSARKMQQALIARWAAIGAEA